jgi:hypothetical protein
MAGAVHGSVAVVLLDGNDISEFCNSVTWPNGVDTHEVTTFGNTRKKYKAGLGDGKPSIGGPFDSTADSPSDTMNDLIDAGDVVTLVYRPEGTGGGLPQRSVGVIVTSYNESSPVGDVVSWTSEFQMSGTIDNTPQA